MALEERVRAAPEQAARALVDALVDRKASDIVLLDLRDVSIITDYFVICTGTSERQIGTLVRTLSDVAGALGYPARRIEGEADGGWVLLDFEDVIAHVFSPQQREFYNLDELWREARSLLVIQ